MKDYTVTHLKHLESEAIFVLRETAAQFNNPALLFSGGKDSIVMTHLAVKAFWPAKIPFPLVHIDTGHNFDETIQYRDRMVKKLGARLIIGSVPDAIENGLIREEKGPKATRNSLQIPVLLKSIEDGQYDAALGGARRDEEKARAKERFFSARTEFGEWDPKNQRPELWNIFNGRKCHGEHFRVFPLSNWTEMDIWQYIRLEEIELPSLYFAHDREVFSRDEMLLALTEFIELLPGEKPASKTIRFRTIGDATCTGAVESYANTVDDIIMEVAAARVGERGGRADDKRSETAMEDRKKQGYF